MKPHRLDVPAVRNRLKADGEAALIDVREKRPFGNGHILLATNIPMRLLEADLPRLVPGRSAELIFCDDDSGLVDQAVTAAAALGYSRFSILDGGVDAWSDAGGVLFEGENVLGTSLAEFVDETSALPKLAAQELVSLRQSGAAPVVLDSRPWEAYRTAHIPGAISCPGGELVYCIAQLAPDPATPVVVNCAGRSRSIYGAQSLINAGIPNPVHSLNLGTVGWWGAGLELAVGEGPRAEHMTNAVPEASFAAAHRLALACGVREINGSTLAQWQSESGVHSLHLLDVRLPDAYAAGHVPGAQSAPGGQLVECSDDWIGLRGGRVVLTDDDGVRARMTGSWLRQLGYNQVAVMAPGEQPKLSEVGFPPDPWLAAPSGVPDASYYPVYETLEQELLASEHHVVEQVRLPELIRRDGLVDFLPYQPARGS